MFTPKQKRIYKWHDGQRERRIDPLVVELSMTKTLGTGWRGRMSAMEKYGEFYDHRDKIGPKVHAELAIASMQETIEFVSAIRIAFGLGDPCNPADDEKPSFDAEQCMNLLTDFFNFFTELEESARPLPSSPPSSDLAATNSPTESSSASMPVATSA